MKKNIIVIIALLLGAARASAEGTVYDLSVYTADNHPVAIYLRDGDVLTGTLDVEHCPIRVYIDYLPGSDPIRVTLRDVIIEGMYNLGCEWAGISCQGSATITLEGENIVRGFDEDYPGIFVPIDMTLTIGGTGRLIASPFIGGGYGSNAAGIGGGNQIPCGKIVITGGTIEATGGNNAAGIGAGYYAACDGIEITGGTVTATGGIGAVGIGSGISGSCSGGVTISGGTIIANGDFGAAGIGSCVMSSCGPISITGGTIEATGGYYAAAIGSGYSPGGNPSTCGDITISSGVTMITATKSSYSPNIIGAGKGSPDVTVTIDPSCNSANIDENTKIICGEGIYPLIPDATRKIWTLDAMPGGNIELTAEYYPYAHVVAPTASENIMFGADAPIVTGASATGGTLKYAVTPATADAAPADGWSTDAPVANQLTSAGKLKVWYYAEGDATHSNTEPTVPVDVLVTRNIAGGADYIVATMSEGLTTPMGVQAYLPLSYEPGASEITLTPLGLAPQDCVVILGSDPEGSSLPDEITLAGTLDDQSSINAKYNAALEAMDKKHFAITNGNLTLGEVIAATGHTPSDAVVMVLSGGKFRAVDISDGDLDLNAKPGLLLFILSKWEYMQVGTKTSGAATRGIAIAGGDGGATGLTPVPSPTGEGNKAQWYDMQGRRIAQPARKGVYIYNGKKHVVR